MMKTNDEYALKTAVELAKINVQATTNWTTPEEVSYFIEGIYSFLTGKKPEQE